MNHIIEVKPGKSVQMPVVETAFASLLIIHGLIHSLGFLQAFGYLDVKLGPVISQPFGIVWILATVFFLITAVLVVFKSKNWWYVGLGAAVLSQFLVTVFWQDTKYATIINALVFVGVFMSCAAFIFQNQYRRDIKANLQQPDYFENSLLTEADISELPEAVQKYLRFSGSVNKSKVNNFRVEFTGKIRKDERSEWMPFTSQQYNFMHAPTRLFFMKAYMKKLPVAGYHSFLDGVAFMDIRLFSLFKVQYQKGPEMNLSETVTFFNDMCCLAPATLIDKRVQWLEVKGDEVRASFTNNNITVSAWLYFNDKGALINFISQDRFSADAAKQLPWATPLKTYQQINGYNLMRNALTIYSYPDRDLAYGTFELTSIEYNCKTINGLI